MRYYIIFIIVLVLVLVFMTYIGYINYVDHKEAVVFSNQVYILDETKNNVKNINNNEIKVMTYNIRHGVGIDGKLDLERIYKIIASSGAKIIGLNEVDNEMFRSDFKKQYQILAKKLKMNYVFGSTLRGIRGSYGNAILTTFPIEKVKNYSLPVSLGHEPRGVLEARIVLPDRTKLLVLSTHLSADEKEREKQIKWLKNYLASIDKEPFVLMGDFNNQVGFFEGFELLSRTSKTYPAESPSESIDMIFSNCFLGEGVSINSRASDHFPLLVEIKCN